MLKHTHKTKIRSRLEILLAQIAGHDINLPFKPQNILEKLLYEIGERVNSLSSKEKTNKGG